MLNSLGYGSILLPKIKEKYLKNEKFKDNDEEFKDLKQKSKSKSWPSNSPRNKDFSQENIDNNEEISAGPINSYKNTDEEIKFPLSSNYRKIVEKHSPLFESDHLTNEIEPVKSETENKDIEKRLKNPLTLNSPSPVCNIFSQKLNYV